jgi:hypothetical protein
VFNTERKNEMGEAEVAICPLCDLRVEFIGAPMVRCYSTGETDSEIKDFERNRLRCGEYKGK